MFSWVLVDCSACTTEVYLKLAAAGIADATTHCIRIPAGGRFSIGLRGHVGARGVGIETLGIKAGAGETVRLLAQMDKAS